MSTFKSIEAQLSVAETRPRKRRWGDILAPYLFISPFILSFLLLFLGPALYALGVSFYRFRGYGKATWLGLKNYQKHVELRRVLDRIRQRLFLLGGPRHSDDDHRFFAGGPHQFQICYP